LILSPKNQNIISIEDLKKRYSSSHEITNELIERNSIANIKETQKTNSNLTLEKINKKYKKLLTDDSNTVKENLKIQINQNTNTRENKPISINLNYNSNENKELIYQDLILPACLTNSISILSITDKMNVRLINFKFY